MSVQRSGRWELVARWQHEALRRIRAGESTKAVAHAVGRSVVIVNRLLVCSGGFVRRARRRSPLRLSLAEREEISRGLERGLSLRAIAVQLHRAPSSISREVRRCGGAAGYRAWSADAAALRLARRPKCGKIERSPRLRAAVERLLALRWSPEQISHGLVREYPGDEEMRVSHETIYRSLFVQSKGSLRRELTRYLRTRRERRHPRRQRPISQMHDLVPISARPAEASDRAVPGHWEGGLLMGQRAKAAIGTLVERRTRYTLLVSLRQGHTAPVVRAALARTIRRLPVQLRRSLTWDQGKEMAEHQRFSIESGVQVYFADPSSPWQRGTNENTNGLLRQYFPRGTDFSRLTQASLDRVARELNGRPRETLHWRTPAEVFTEIVGSDKLAR